MYLRDLVIFFIFLISEERTYIIVLTNDIFHSAFFVKYFIKQKFYIVFFLTLFKLNTTTIPTRITNITYPNVI